MDGARQLLALPERPTAVFGAYGNVTQGVLAELRRQGVSVPEEMSVISMDHTPDPLDETLDVAYVDDMIETVCTLAMREIESRMMEPRTNTPLTLTIPTCFHAGETVAEPR